MQWSTDGSVVVTPSGQSASTIACTSHGIRGGSFAEFKKVTTVLPKDGNGNPAYPEYDCLPDNLVLAFRGYFNALTSSGYATPPIVATGTPCTFTYIGGETTAGSGIIRVWADEGAEAAEQGFDFEIVVMPYTRT